MQNYLNDLVSIEIGFRVEVIILILVCLAIIFGIILLTIIKRLKNKD